MPAAGYANAFIYLKNCKTVDTSSICRQILLFVEDVRSLKIISTQINSDRLWHATQTQLGKLYDAC
ncbi:hypothetical protein [uncultured Nostoc sp.]|uniref:hypothetical protein n=1 Tax=uncultured Nostoc sp. TaxID=340711 RepID=UPI0035CA89A8